MNSHFFDLLTTHDINDIHQMAGCRSLSKNGGQKQEFSRPFKNTLLFNVKYFTV